jgi:hypothetical protein
MTNEILNRYGNLRNLNKVRATPMRMRRLQPQSRQNQPAKVEVGMAVVADEGGK